MTVHGVPAPQGSKRHIGRGALIEQSKRVAPWREAVKHAALAAAHPTGFRRLEGPVRCDITFVFDKPKSAPKRRRTWPITRSSGDVDKLQRAVFDALTDAGVMRDDSQVVDVRARKVHTGDPDAPLQVPGAVIRVWEVTDA
ncbi:MAG: RusA family crossover junction endodeoxyribonuclease [Microbispora sp.]|nr:RusA family crossover junction endodeoxyribonuclease [Microbispora sp.]